MLQLYIKYIDGNYYLLDLEDSEAINYKLTVKDLNDINKIWSPFTQSFNLKATDKNKMLCGFVGNEKILRLNNDGVFDAMIYISGFIFESGKLSFDEINYEFWDQKNFKTNFASNLTSLTEKLGDTTIQQLFQDSSLNFDSNVKIDWNQFTLKDSLTTVRSKNLTNGIEFKYGIPFISNNRAWLYDDENLDVVDNIAFKKSRTEQTVNQISLSEIRPAVNYMSIMNHLLLKIGTPVICPLFEKPEVKDLFVWCNSESLVVPSETAYSLTNFSNLTLSRYDVKDQIEDAPDNPKWNVSYNSLSSSFTIQRSASFNTVYWSDGLLVNLKFNDLISLEGTETKIKVVLRNVENNVILDSQEITGNAYSWRLLDPVGGPSQLDETGSLSFKIEILPITLLKWSSIGFEVFQRYYHSRKSGVGLGTRVTKASFSYESVNNTSSDQLGGNKLNLITALPKMKCVDFLKSFFKTFNISVVSTGLQDQSMYWLTASDLKEVNRPYSKRVVDWTPYVDSSSLNKKKGNTYNQYLFSHLTNSKYFDAVYGDGSMFGSLIYPETTPAKVNKFEVTTNYSIIKQNPYFDHPSTAKMCFGFSKDSPTIADNGGVRYKPVYDEFTLMYLQPKSLGASTLSVEYSKTVNAELFGILESNFVNSFNGKTLSFGAVDTYTDSLYVNYYMDFINLLLSPNTYKSEFNLTLPPNEIFLNFANLNQGESNIPTGYRAQNEIIIGEQRYTQSEISIDLTKGKTKLTALNF